MEENKRKIEDSDRERRRKRICGSDSYLEKKWFKKIKVFMVTSY